MRQQQSRTKRNEMISICFLQKYGGRTSKTIEGFGPIGYSFQMVRSGPTGDWSTNSDRSISDGDRGCCPKNRTCDSSKRCHKRKWNINHYINSLKKCKDWIMVLFIQSCVPHYFLDGVVSRGFGFSVMREGYDNRVSKAVKQLELTCTVVNWDARDTREQWQC